MSRGSTYDGFNEPLGSSGYRRSDDDFNSYSSSYGPGSGLSGFYTNNKKRIFICLGITVAVIVLIAIIAAVANRKGGDPPGPNAPGTPDQWTTIADLSTYRAGNGPRIILYLPDVAGRRQAALDLVEKYGQEAGYSTYLMDYFDGGTYNSSNPQHAPAVAAQRVRNAISVLRSQDGITSVQVTGYCYGGGVAVLLADGASGVDSAVAAHAAFVNAALISNISIPVFFVMPQYDPSFNNPAPTYLTTTDLRNQEVAYKIYTNQTHGFAVTVDNTNPLAVAMQQRSFDDTISWFEVHASGTPAPNPAQYTNMTLGDLTTYVFGSGANALLYLQDAAGVRPASLQLAGWYADAGFTVFYPDYFDGGAWNSGNASQSLPVVTARVMAALRILRNSSATTIQAVGYCYGGGVGVNLMQSTDPATSIESGVFAHASLVNAALVSGIQRPVSFVMPQNDPGFNNAAPQYMAITLANGVEAEYKTYPYTSHGFAVSVDNTNATLVAMQLRAYQDTAKWLITHQTVGTSWPITPSNPTPAVSSSTGGAPAPPGPVDNWTTIADLPAYRAGTGSRVLLYLPDVFGRRQAALDLVERYGQVSAYSTYLMDYFDGGTYNGSNPQHAPAVAAQRVRNAIQVLRAQDGVVSVQVTGYCYGGGVAVLLADGASGVDSAVAAHAAFLNSALISNISVPVFFVMPQYDAGFNNYAPGYLTITDVRNQEVAYKIYTNQTHGFAVTVDSTNALAVAMQQRSFDDTVNWLNIHSNSATAPNSASYTNTTLGDLPTYVFGSGSPALLFLQDINGVRGPSLQVASWYAASGFTVYYVDYFDGGTRNASNPMHSTANATARVMTALAVLRQQSPSIAIQAVGYCYGGGVGVLLLQSTNQTVSVDSAVFAHASGLTNATVSGIQRPVSFVMPQSDPGFNNAAPGYMAITLRNGVEAEYKTYPNTTHGFAISVNNANPYQVAMQLRAYQDTAAWLLTHQTLGTSWPITPSGS